MDHLKKADEGRFCFYLPWFQCSHLHSHFEGCLAVSTLVKYTSPLWPTPTFHSPGPEGTDISIHIWIWSVYKNAHEGFSDNGPKISQVDGGKLWQSHGSWDQTVINMRRQQFVQLSAWLPKPCESWQKEDDKVQACLQTRTRCRFVYWNPKQNRRCSLGKEGTHGMLQFICYWSTCGVARGKYKYKTLLYIYKNIKIFTYIKI